MERIPDDLDLPPDESLALAQDLLDRGRAFHAHEVLEAAWKNGPAEERPLWQGLAQVAVGITHIQRGNASGAQSLLARGAERIGHTGDPAPHGVDVPGLVAHAHSLIAELRAGDLPSPDRLAPRLVVPVRVTEHLGVVIRRPPEVVYQLAADPEMLPRWAAGLASGQVRREGSTLVVDSPMGEVRVRFADPNPLGVLDHEVELPDGSRVHNPLRVLTHPDGSEVVFTLRSLSAGGDDDEFRRDAEAVAADLARLKTLAETTPARTTAGSPPARPTAGRASPGPTPPPADEVSPPMPGHDVRLARPADAADIGGMLAAFNSEFGASGPDAAGAAGRIERMLAGDAAFVVVAPDPSGSSPLGFALITLRPSPYQDGPVAQLDELYVRPEHRGRGIGGAMMALAVDAMRDRGCAECLINVDAHDEGARRFYERLGWSHRDPDSGSPMLCYLRELGHQLL